MQNLKTEKRQKELTFKSRKLRKISYLKIPLRIQKGNFPSQVEKRYHYFCIKSKAMTKIRRKRNRI